MISRVRAASPATTLLLHLLVFPNTPFSPCAYPIRGAQIRNVRRTSLLPLLSLHGAVPYSYSRKSVRSTLDCRTRNAPPPSMPETAILRQAGLPYIDRPRILPHSPAHTERPLFFRPNLLERPCRSEFTGRSTDPKMLWPYEKHWPLDLITRCSGRARSAGCSD